MSLACITEPHASCDGCAAFGNGCQELSSAADLGLREATVETIYAGASLDRLIQDHTMPGVTAASIASELLGLGSASTVIACHKERLP